MLADVTGEMETDVTDGMLPDVTTGMVPDVTTEIVAYVTTHIMNNVTFTPGLTLQQQNDEEFYRRLAPVIYLAVLMVVGIPGNLLVLVVYFRDFTRSTHRTFILSLAALDLSVCLVSLPFEIFEMRFQYTFYNVIACKLFRANNNFLSLGSIFTIFCMSIDRYRRVCRPLRIQMTPSVSLLYCFGALVVSLIFAWPNFVISGIRNVSFKHNVTGSDCSLSDQFAKTIYPIVYGGVLFIIFLIVIVFLIVVYSLIARKIHKHSKFRDNFQSTSSCSSTPTQVSAISNPNSNESNEKNKSSKEAGLEQVELDMTSPTVKQEDIKPSAKVNFSSSEATEPVAKSTTKNISSTGTSQRTANRSTKANTTLPNASRKRTAKITRITFTISLVFILSYLPHLVLSLMTAVKGGFVAKPGPIVSALLPIVTRSIFINNVANPLIYGFLDPKFRQSCKNAIKIVLR
ncbi:putative tyramine receptor 2 isoform X1 [Mizuhopecten yessoensis]|uniref:Cholecystokinin receptor n=1 Tax=Mizuhopecten yessoensis TaxID=6573 RepID=A0A210QP61_MIZYE|nr:putative tyramine receptor 2 isoform X1 [Mizuhopecten yessoensis]XP_021353268.1 putative tyramine receptor 2 isoform X1 [Mizuhopecten yessoensis]OWF50527.1 Cholecystokinin receptor [Mizuhopecten yessoensis]